MRGPVNARSASEDDPAKPPERIKRKSPVALFRGRPWPFCRELISAKDNNMPVRATFFGIVVLALSQPLAADPPRAQGCARDDMQTERPPLPQACAREMRWPQHTPDILLIRPGPAPLGDVLGARGSQLHARQLTSIAIYASVGNRDAVEILSRQLRRFGVRRADIEDAIEATKLHASFPNALLFQQY
jgi:hypothetical protein